MPRFPEMMSEDAKFALAGDLDLCSKDIRDGSDGLQLGVDVRGEEPADAGRLLPDRPSQLRLRHSCLLAQLVELADHRVDLGDLAALPLKLRKELRILYESPCKSPATLAGLTDERPTIRRCRRDETQAVLDLWAAERSTQASIPDRVEDVERLVGDGSPAALLVAEAAGRVVGAAIAAWDGWRGNVYRLAVDDEHRRHGIGILLVRAAEDYLLSCGARRVTALVAFDDDAAGAFWDSVGYPPDREIGRRVRNVQR